MTTAARTRLLIAGLLLVAIGLFFALGGAHVLSLGYFQSRQAEISAWVARHATLAALIYFLAYVAVAGLSLPGGLVMTLIGGALFGFVEGLILVSFASTIGASMAFIVSRYLFHNTVQQRFGRWLDPVNQGIKRDGAFYLFTLRLVPAFPFFMINLVFGLTPIRLATFFTVSQIGMLPATAVYVNAGTQLASIHSIGQIASPSLIGALVLLGLFPLAARLGLNKLRARRALAGYTKPKVFDTNVVVIGGGSGGLVASYIAAAVKARVTLVEHKAMGGECLNTGCVPSKALIRSARAAYETGRADEFGLRCDGVEVDFTAVMDRVQRTIKQIAPHDSRERFERLGVDVVQDTAVIRSPWTVAVGEREIRTRAIVVATGAAPRIPAIPGLHTVDYLTTDTVWGLRERPERLMIIGAGPVGCELAQAFSRLGCRVTLLSRTTQLLPREDADIAEPVRAQFQTENIELRTGFNVTEIQGSKAGAGVVTGQHAGETIAIGFDRLLLAVGRQPNVKGLGLERLGVELADDQSIETDSFLQTNVPGIYVCGDVAGPHRFTHAAAHQAWHASVNALFGGFKRFKVDYSALPRAVFTDPEIACVGLNEKQAAKHNIRYEVTTYDLGELDRSIADGNAGGTIKVLTVPGKDTILGAAIVGAHAGELIHEFTLAKRHGLGLNKLLSTIHVYPTYMEAVRHTAGQWKQAHAPRRVLAWLARFHAWRRGG